MMRMILELFLELMLKTILIRLLFILLLGMPGMRLVKLLLPVGIMMPELVLLVLGRMLVQLVLIGLIVVLLLLMEILHSLPSSFFLIEVHINPFISCSRSSGFMSVSSPNH